MRPKPKIRELPWLIVHSNFGEPPSTFRGQFGMALVDLEDVTKLDELAKRADTLCSGALPFTLGEVRAVLRAACGEG